MMPETQLSRQNARRRGSETGLSSTPVSPMNDPAGARTQDLRIKSAGPTQDSSGGQGALETVRVEANGAITTHSDATKQSHPAIIPSTIPVGLHGAVAIVDAADHGRLSAYRWHLTTRGYAIRWVRRGGRQAVVRMHHDVLGVDAAVRVDHANRNQLDNRRANLRPCTATENAFNVPRKAGGSSRFKGVHRHHSGRWAAKIQIAGVQKCLGVFDSEEEAARVYDAAASAAVGQFAVLNFDTPMRTRVVAVSRGTPLPLRLGGGNTR